MNSAEPAPNGNHKPANEADANENSNTEKMDIFDMTDSTAATEKLALDMQKRCKLLLDEFEQYQAHLKELKKEIHVELRTFKSGLQAEMKLLNKLAAADPSTPKTKHGLRSSNFSFYSTVWSTAKTCSSVTALGKRFYWIPGQDVPYINGKISTQGTTHRQNSALVDIVAQEGLEWIKVSSVTEKRIIWDLAKAGWVDSSSEEEEDGNQTLDDDEPEGLLKQIEALIKASRATRVRYRHPKVILVLPRIKASPDSKEVRNIIDKTKDMGVEVRTTEDLPLQFPPIADVINAMSVDRFAAFSELLNIDCTILLAFASDLSHGRVEPEHWHNKAISRQIEMESEDQLLPNSLWPACGTKKMVCTKDAAVRMQEIVEIIGTATEKKRAALMLDVNNESHMTRSQRLEEYQKLSSYIIPLDWDLPIQVVNVDLKTIMSNLPPVAQKVADNLTAINKSVFLYGWACGLTTLSSNGSVAKEIEFTIEENRVDEELQGPDIWLTSSSRSLVGKEKQRRGWKDEGEEATVGKMDELDIGT